MNLYKAVFKITLNERTQVLIYWLGTRACNSTLQSETLGKLNVKVSGEVLSTLFAADNLLESMESTRGSLLG